MFSTDWWLGHSNNTKYKTSSFICINFHNMQFLDKISNRNHPQHKPGADLTSSYTKTVPLADKTKSDKNPVPYIGGTPQTKTPGTAKFQTKTTHLPPN